MLILVEGRLTTRSGHSFMCPAFRRTHLLRGAGPRPPRTYDVCWPRPSERLHESVRPMRAMLQAPSRNSVPVVDNARRSGICSRMA